MSESGGVGREESRGLNVKDGPSDAEEHNFRRSKKEEVERERIE